MSSYPNLETKPIGPVILVRPVGDEYLERQQIALMTDDLEAFIRDKRPEKLVLTLKQVSKYSSQAIAGIIRAFRLVQKQGGDMRLCMSDELRELFVAASLDGSIFRIYKTESEAVAAFFEHGGDLFD